MKYHLATGSGKQPRFDMKSKISPFGQYSNAKNAYLYNFRAACESNSIPFCCISMFLSMLQCLGTDLQNFASFSKSFNCDGDTSFKATGASEDGSNPRYTSDEAPVPIFSQIMKLSIFFPHYIFILDRLIFKFLLQYCSQKPF